MNDQGDLRGALTKSHLSLGELLQWVGASRENGVKRERGIVILSCLGLSPNS